METTMTWRELETLDQVLVLSTFSHKLKCDDKEKLARIFNMANPKVTLEANRKYFRIEEESGPTLLLLIKNYLQ